MSHLESAGTLQRLNKIEMNPGVFAVAEVDQDTCDVCDAHNGKILSIDLSGAEFAPLRICAGCLRKLAEAV